MSQKNTRIPFVIPLTVENQQSGSDKTKADAFFASLSNQMPDTEQEIAPTTKLANIKKGKIPHPNGKGISIRHQFSANAK